MSLFIIFFFFTDPATTEIYTLSLHDALPISRWEERLRPKLPQSPKPQLRPAAAPAARRSTKDRKSTRLNSSHGSISYAVFCLKKKKTNNKIARKHHYLQNQ